MERKTCATAWLALCCALPLNGLAAEQPAADDAAGSSAAAVAKPAAGKTLSGRNNVLSDYRVGPQDLLEIQTFGVEALSRTVRVNSRGAISLPLIGVIEVAGLTSEEVEARIAAKLSQDYLQDPHVSVFIKEYTSQRVTVEGAVNRPGIYPLKGQTSLLQAIAIAGGQASMSNINEVMLFRSDDNGVKKILTFDVEKVRSGEAEDPLVQDDDVIVVQRSRSRTFLKDSLFRDILDTLNPFSFGK